MRPTVLVTVMFCEAALTLPVRAASFHNAVYDAYDYADIMEHVITRWNVGSLRVGEASHAADAQAWLMAQPDRVRRLADIAAKKRAKKAPLREQFAWIFNRQVDV